MTLPVLPNGANGQPLTPDKANYITSSQPGAVIQTKLDGGGSAFRLDKLNAASLITVTWSISAVDYATLYAFWKTTLIIGSLPFTASLYLESNVLQAYTCHFMPDTFGIQSVSGDTTVVGAQLEVF